MTRERGLMVVMVMGAVVLTAMGIVLWYVGEGGLAIACAIALVFAGAMIMRARKKQKMMGGDE